MNIIMGLNYDIFGRKTPLLVGFTLVILGQFALPFVRTFTGFFVVGLF
jgi:hypothetical protein